MDQITALSLARIVFGGGSYVAPRLSLRAMALDTEGASPTLLRFFGGRDAALGALTLLAPAEQRRALVMAGVLVDSGDALASLLALRNGSTPKPAGIAIAAMAAGAVTAGVTFLRR